MKDEETKMNLWWNWKLNRTLKGPLCEGQCRFKVNLSKYQMNFHKNLVWELN